MNHYEDQAHQLLQKLISKQKNAQFTQLYQIYLSNILKVTKHSLETLNAACQLNNLPEKLKLNEVVIESTRIMLLKWILQSQTKKQFDTDVYSDPIAAVVLTSLICKQWPIEEQKPTTYKCSLEKTEDIYMLNSFEKFLIEPNKENPSKEIAPKTFLIYKDVLNELMRLLNESCCTVTNTSKSEDIKNVVNAVILLVNVYSRLFEMNVLDESYFESHDELKLLIGMFEECFKCFASDLNEFNCSQKLPVLKQIRKLFSIKLHPTVFWELRQCVRVETMQILIGFLNNCK